MKRVLESLVVVAVLAGVAAAEEIKEIVVEENTKTTDETVILIADVEVGDDWSTDMADKIKLELINSGLFKDVNVYWDPVPGGVRLHLMAIDKHPWVIAPTAYNQPTNKGGGLGFGHNNLGGDNEKLLLYGQLATGDSFFIGAFIDPSIAGSSFHYQMDVFLKTGRVIEYESPDMFLDDPGPLRISRLNYLNAGLKLGVDIWKLSLDARIRAAEVWYWQVRPAVQDDMTVPLDEIDPTPPVPGVVPEPGGEGEDVSVEGSLSYDGSANFYGISTGDRWRLAYERSIAAISDFDYWYMTASYRLARKFFERHNLVIKGEVQYGKHLPFQQEFLVGGTSMRGWKNGQYRGDIKVAGNLEYSVPLFTISGLSLRALGFWDTAYITFADTSDEAAERARRHYLPGGEARGFDAFKNSVGIGTRLYLRQIVLPLLGVDLGYGVERNAFEVYIAIGLTD